MGTSSTDDNEQRDTAPARPRRPGTWLLFGGVPAAWLAFLFALYLVGTRYEAVGIYSSSMMPALEAGDLVVSQQDYYRAHLPARGEIVALSPPGYDETMLFVVRVIGLPGDTVQMVRGILRINGKPVGRQRLPDFAFTDVLGTRAVAQYRETLPGGTTHRILELHGDAGRLDETRPYVVAPGHYYVLGDNRDISNDSRNLGAVPLGRILHRPAMIYWSRDLARIGRFVQ